jgi:isopropylmalate/homocitrate/citramalate synthase
MPDWIDAGLDGIEVGHPDYGPEEKRRYREIARSLGLVATPSSYFHGR